MGNFTLPINYHNKKWKKEAMCFKKCLKCLVTWLEWHNTHQCTIQKLSFWDSFGWDETQSQDPIDFFFLCRLTPNGRSFLPPMYLPLPIYLPSHLPTPSFTLNIMLLPSPLLCNIAITYAPFLSSALPLVARSCVANNYVVTSSKKLHY